MVLSGGRCGARKRPAHRGSMAWKNARNWRVRRWFDRGVPIYQNLACSYSVAGGKCWRGFLEKSRVWRTILLRARFGVGRVAARRLPSEHFAARTGVPLFVAAEGPTSAASAPSGTRRPSRSCVTSGVHLSHSFCNFLAMASIAQRTERLRSAAIVYTGVQYHRARPFSSRHFRKTTKKISRKGAKAQRGNGKRRNRRKRER